MKYLRHCLRACLKVQLSENSRENGSRAAGLLMLFQPMSGKIGGKLLVQNHIRPHGNKGQSVILQLEAPLRNKPLEAAFHLCAELPG